MGTLSYSRSLKPAEIDDRLLAHLHVVIEKRFVARESFMLHLPTRPDGSVVLWMNHEVPIHLTYRNATGSLNSEWLAQLIESAQDPSGLFVMPEPVQP